MKTWIALGVLGWMVGAVPIMAQPTIDLVPEAEVLAEFTDARSLAVDPAGVLYVVDAGRDAVLLLEPSGYVKATLGGPGTEAGQFDEPADIDPTNGLVWVVADAGNRRIQRFSRSFLHLESVPIFRGDRYETGRYAGTGSPGEQAARESGDGRPVGVAMSRAGEMFVLDAAQGLVLKWDASRRFERAIGGYSRGAGSLSEPVALAVSGDRLLVADRNRAAVLVYDLFGGFMHTLAEGLASETVNLSIDGETVWIVLPAEILVYDLAGSLQRRLAVDLGEPLVDATGVPGALYLLTASRLLQVPR